MIRKSFALLALAVLVLFGQPALADGYPAGQASTPRYTGAVVDFSSGTDTTTYDITDFGFQSNYVRLCLRTASVPIYIRFGTAVTTSTSTLSTAASGIRLTAPVSTSAAFIGGVSGVLPEGALPMAVRAVSADNTTVATTNHCTTQPWKTRGLVMHVVTGLATVDVWAF